jgi:fructokinase
MKRQPVVIGIGELLWDMLPTGKKVGGAPVNFAYHASRMGAAGYAISAVGFDQLGDELLREIDKAGINTIIERVDYPTGTVQVELNDGMPDYTINEGVAWDHIPLTWAMEQLVAKADAVCFGTLAQRSEISRKTIMRLLSSAPADAYRILDINIRRDYYSKELVTDSLRSCNVLKINDEELMLLKRLYGKEQDTDEALSRWLLDQYKLIFLILTAGADYSTIYTPRDISCIKTPEVDVVDTVGAGDSFTGAFISALLQGKPLPVAHQVAVERAAYVCTQSGAWV